MSEPFLPPPKSSQKGPLNPVVKLDLSQPKPRLGTEEVPTSQSNEGRRGGKCDLHRLGWIWRLALLQATWTAVLGLKSSSPSTFTQ